MRILIVEDDPTTARALELMLRHANMNPCLTPYASDASEFATLYDYNLITLDINLLDGNGLDVLAGLRARGIKTPVLMLTGDASTDTKIRAFGLGADDYMSKPFHREELIARITAIVRRSKGYPVSQIATGPMTIDLDKQSVLIKGRGVFLTKKEYQILELLSLRKGTTLTKEMFMNHLYGGMDEPELKIIDVFINKLRKKLAEVDRHAGTDAAAHIETVWGRGYRLVDNVREEVK